MLTTYGDITPRTAAYVARDLLKRGLPLLVFEKFMQGKSLPAHNTKSMIFRRYLALALATTPLIEGVTPRGQKLTKVDVSITLDQYGDLVEITDVVQDTHEDPIIEECKQVLGEQAAQTIETIRYYVLRACSNKYRANGSARTDINTPLVIGLQKKIVRGLKRQNAMKITSIIKSDVRFNTEAVNPCFVALGHTDLENDIRAMTGFIDAKNYGTTAPFEGEVGAVNDVRYVLSNILTPFTDGGGAKAGSGTTMISTSGTNADVYPVIYLARDSWAGVALKGAFAVQPTVINPTPSKSDPLGQRGSIGWKTMQGAVILNDAWMAVAEVAVTELT